MSFRVKWAYKKLYAAFGPQHWWPADEPFEVIVGAILTQNTSWTNVEKALVNLKEAGLLNPEALFKISEAELAGLIRPAGYYNIKAKRLKSFLRFFFSSYAGDIKKLIRARAPSLRRELLSVKGIGPETADSILLYALGKPVFVVDAYTRRILMRHGLALDENTYDKVQTFFLRRLKSNAGLFNEYHALLVRLGKDFCRKSAPRCRACPLGAPKTGQ